MKYLLDTCTISETAKRIPSERVLKWLRSVPPEELYLSSTAGVHGMKLVTRNVEDMAGMGVPILNPFEQ